MTPDTVEPLQVVFLFESQSSVVQIYTSVFLQSEHFKNLSRTRRLRVRHLCGAANFSPAHRAVWNGLGTVKQRGK